VHVSTVRWWVVCFSSGNSNSRSPSLVQIVMNVGCRVLLIACENAQLMVVTILKSSFFVGENFFYLIVLFCSLCFCSFCGNKKEALLKEQIMYIVLLESHT